MRHMYDSDGNIPYAGAVRASRRWQGSRTRSGQTTTNRRNRTETISEAEVRLARSDHKANIAAILASSTWQHNFNN
jgi:hypothetical protein